MTKQQLIKRWDTSSGSALKERIFLALKKRMPLSNVEGIEKYAGRFDLRGIKLPKPKSVKEMHSYEMFTDAFILSKIEFVGIDFSYSSFAYCYIDECAFENCIFEEVNFRSCKVDASTFKNLDFIRCDFNFSFLNGNKRKNSGEFKNVSFIECDLSKTIFGFPEITSCLFRNCKMVEVNFSGSRFKDTKFVGTFQSGWIRGYAGKGYTLNGFFNYDDLQNKMLNVDFSECELDDVTFLDGVDLTSCIFPKSSVYLKIINLDKVYPEVLKVINGEWSEAEKKAGLHLVNMLYYSDKKRGMKMDFIKKIYTKHIPHSTVDKLYDLIEKVSKS